MPLFQQSVLRQYTGHLSKDDLKNKYQLFKNHFHNPEIQENILNAKEEEYQEGFVRDLFVNILGYTLNPQPNYNFVLEKKTEVDSTKSDGAILVAGKVVGILELKDTYTTDLGKVEKQAFGYKHRHPDCTYVITSNFQKLRFYINDAIEFIEFNLFTLTEKEFELLYSCLEYQSIFKGIPALIKRSSLSQEAGITKKLYADYSQFKSDLFNNIVAQNPQYNKLELFKKTQKLLDRFLFILFAEDRLLVPANSVRDIIDQWEKLKELDNYVPLFDRFRKYFGYLNTGHEGKHHEIFAYNGGLFAPDEILDTITIDDTILYNGTKKLSDYDFESEVDVNILGHIFEHSLSQIEEVQAELEGTAIEKAKTKRKKDGVFYTPRYITKYIVENTVGELCRLKKEELNLTDDEFAYRKRKDRREAKLKKLDDYRNWLFQLTICDPACGSGAFLNQALDFLIAEHGYIDELRAKLFGDAMALSDVETTILENNLFGVDINEEAVEIARLSLWLRTARKGRKLNDLSKNIKCGNSLIDDPAIAGDKAFNWQKEFPQVFGEYKEKHKKLKETEVETEIERQEEAITDTNEVVESGDKATLPKEQVTNQDLRITNEDSRIVNEAQAIYRKQNKNGFDVIIGNPPYVFTRGNDFFEKIKSFIWNKFQYNQGKINLYSVFLELSLSVLLKEKGLLGFITPETFIRTSTYSKIRKFLYQSFNIVKIELYGIGVFENVTAETIVMIIKKKFSTDNQIYFNRVEKELNQEYIVSQKSFDTTQQNRFIYESTKEDDYLFLKLKNNSFELGTIIDVRNGVATKAGKKDFISNDKLTEKYKKLLEAPEIFRYGFNWEGNYINYDREVLHRPRKEETFLSDKILIQRVSSRLICCYDNEKFYTFNSINNLVLINEAFSLKYIISLLNSKLINYLYRIQFSMDAGFTITVTKENLDVLPIKNILKTEQLPFIQKAEIMLSKNKELQQAKQQLLKLLQAKYEGIVISKKLQDWPSLGFKDFLIELTKQKIKLTLAEQTEWMQYFETEKAKANTIQELINTTDKEIDQMVYTLYGLTEEEIKIVEGV